MSKLDYITIYCLEEMHAVQEASMFTVFLYGLI